MKLLSFPSVSLTKSSMDEIASSMEAAHDGVLYVTDLPMAPLDTAIPELLDHLATNDDLGRRLNQAYTNNLVYKDSWKAGKGGPAVDRKRVLDLSPERLQAIAEADPSLLQLDPTLQATLAFWDTLRVSSDKLSRSLAMAIGSDEMLQDVFFNFRMVDYYTTAGSSQQVEDTSITEEPPRCGEHRDFGSFTLIYARQPGLELFHEASKTWVPIPVASQDDGTSAVLLFGWCTQIRSNGRIPAALHRVVNSNSNGDDDRRRVSAVFFTAPKHCDTFLTPVLRPKESPRYVANIQVGQLRGNMAKKWQSREGTLSPYKAIEEEEEIRVTNRFTQDDVVRDLVAVHS